MNWKKCALFWISGFFAAPGVAHLLRFAFGWHVVVESYTVTPFCSVFVAVVALGLSALSFFGASRMD